MLFLAVEVLGTTWWDLGGFLVWIFCVVAERNTNRKIKSFFQFLPTSEMVLF